MGNATFASRMREKGFNSREIRYYRQKLYRAGYKITDVCDVRNLRRQLCSY